MGWGGSTTAQGCSIAIKGMPFGSLSRGVAGPEDPQCICFMVMASMAESGHS
jgi:hypothetical protein